MKKYLFLAFFFASTFLWGQNNLAPNVRQHLLSNKLIKTKTSADQSLLKAYVLVDSNADLAKLDSLNVRMHLNLDDWLTVSLPYSSLTALSKLSFVKYIQLAEGVTSQMDLARDSAGVSLLHQSTSEYSALTGKGVVVGVVDAGFDYTHPNFQTEEGTLRIKRVWEQDHTGGTPPHGFSYGSELTSADEILRAAGDIQTNSHGTHVAGIAAGSLKANNWYGAAPDAELVLVSISSRDSITADNVNVTDAISYIFNYADSVRKPCVVNLSLGAQIGPHDGTSIFDQMADRLQGAGKIIVGSVGNFGNRKIHLSKKFLSTDDSPLQTFVDFNEKPSASSRPAKVDIWGEVGSDFDVALSIVNYSTGEVIWKSEALHATASESGNLQLNIEKNAKGTAFLTSEINPLNDKPHVLLTLQLSSLRVKHAVGITITPRKAGRVDLWADNTNIQLSNYNRDDWSDGDNHHTLAEIGGTAKGILSVGSYNTRTTYIPLDATNESFTGEKLGDISTFSACGPSLDGRMKPDITAPGSFLISSLSSHDANISLHPLAAYEISADGQSYPYGYMQGTSMSSPLVAGTVANWLQANPRLTLEEIKGALDVTAIPAGDASQWGRGKLHAFETLRYLVPPSCIEDFGTNESPHVKIYSDYLEISITNPTVMPSLNIVDGLGRMLNQCTPTRISHQGTWRINLPAGPGIYLLQMKTEKGIFVQKFVK